MGHEALDWFFEAADLVMDRTVCYKNLRGLFRRRQSLLPPSFRATWIAKTDQLRQNYRLMHPQASWQAASMRTTRGTIRVYHNNVINFGVVQ
jgi:hypothetical protein